ncbi:hypothetical protein VM1G_10828 [Cytospora mali]|uniref:Ubiquitin-like protease family profile domain-containing protein n=1 Tax=Cytospora mali TaxID=578113 RepID=A0A194VJ93_CYTMA|nr:hypothetical protein VM1G_10828 [Valsa mali]
MVAEDFARDLQELQSAWLRCRDKSRKELSRAFRTLIKSFCLNGPGDSDSDGCEHGIASEEDRNDADTGQEEQSDADHDNGDKVNLVDTDNTNDTSDADPQSQPERRLPSDKSLFAPWAMTFLPRRLLHDCLEAELPLYQRLQRPTRGKTFMLQLAKTIMETWPAPKPPEPRPRHRPGADQSSSSMTNTARGRGKRTKGKKKNKQPFRYPDTSDQEAYLADATSEDKLFNILALFFGTPSFKTRRFWDLFKRLDATRDNFFPIYYATLEAGLARQHHQPPTSPSSIVCCLDPDSKSHRMKPYRLILQPADLPESNDTVPQEDVTHQREASASLGFHSSSPPEENRSIQIVVPEAAGLSQQHPAVVVQDGYSDDDFSISMSLDMGSPPRCAVDQDDSILSASAEQQQQQQQQQQQHIGNGSHGSGLEGSPIPLAIEHGRGGLEAIANLSLHVDNTDRDNPSPPPVTPSPNQTARDHAPPGRPVEIKSPSLNTTALKRTSPPIGTPLIDYIDYTVDASPFPSTSPSKRARLGPEYRSAWDDLKEQDIERLADGNGWLNDSIVASLSAMAACSIHRSEMVDPVLLDDDSKDNGNKDGKKDGNGKKDEQHLSRDSACNIINNIDDADDNYDHDHPSWAIPLRGLFEEGHATMLLGCFQAGAHWRSFEAHPARLHLKVYDSSSSRPSSPSSSSGSPGPQAAGRLKPDVRNKIAALFAHVFPHGSSSLDSWTVDATAPCAQQQNGNDCGIYSIVCLLRLATGTDPSLELSSEQASVWRMVMRALAEKTTCVSVMPWEVNTKIAAAEIPQISPEAGGSGQQQQSTEQQVDPDTAMRPLIDGVVRIARVYIKRYAERKEQAEEGLRHMEQIQHTLGRLAVAIGKAQAELVPMVDMSTKEYCRLAQAIDALKMPFTTKDLPQQQDMVAKLEAQARATYLAGRAWQRRLQTQQASLERLRVLDIEAGVSRVREVVAGYNELIARQEETLEKLAG